MSSIKGSLEYRQFIVLDDGTEIRVRYNQDPTLYEGTEVQLYEYEAKEGKGDDAQIVTRYAVPFEQALRSKRNSDATIQSMLASGMSASEILASQLARAQAKIEAKIAKLS